MRVKLVGNAIHHHTADSLSLRDRAIFVREEQSLQIYNLLTQLSYLCTKGIILATEYFNFSLKVGKPLLLALSTFQGGDTGRMSVYL